MRKLHIASFSRLISRLQSTLSIPPASSMNRTPSFRVIHTSLEANLHEIFSLKKISILFHCLWVSRSRKFIRCSGRRVHRRMFGDLPRVAIARGTTEAFPSTVDDNCLVVYVPPIFSLRGMRLEQFCFVSRLVDSSWEMDAKQVCRVQRKG